MHHVNLRSVVFARLSASCTARVSPNVSSTNSFKRFSVSKGVLTFASCRLLALMSISATALRLPRVHIHLSVLQSYVVKERVD